MIKALCFGAVLWDVVDTTATLGGAPLNLAANLKKLNLDVCMYTCLGEDDYGQRAIEQIRELGIHDKFIRQDSSKLTGYAEIVFDQDKVPSYQFSKDASHEYIAVSDIDVENVNKEKFDLVCWGTFCQRGEVSRKGLNKLLREVEFGLKFCDINLREDKIDCEMVADAFRFADILKLNDEEFIRISRVLYGKSMNENEFVKLVQKDFQIDVICITKGSQGCLVYDKAGNRMDVKAPQIEVIDTVGAGDAFSAGFLSALLQNKTLEECGKAGNILGAYVAAHKGAIVDYTEQLRSQL